MKTYIMYDRNWKLTIFTEAEIIQNAKEQEAAGYTPRYARRYGKDDYSPAGWLVCSSYNSGCIVVYKRASDNKYIITKGCQGDYVVM